MAIGPDLGSGLYSHPLSSTGGQPKDTDRTGTCPPENLRDGPDIVRSRTPTSTTHVPIVVSFDPTPQQRRSTGTG